MKPILDVVNIEIMLELLGEDVKDIIRQYAEKLKAEIEELNHLYISENWEKLIRQAHTLKGSSSSIGAAALAAEAARLEHATRLRQQSEMQDALAKLAPLAEQTISALHAKGYV